MSWGDRNEMEHRTMNDIIHGIVIPKRREDGYVNASKLCKETAGRAFSDYRRLNSTETHLKTLSEETGIPVSGKYGLIQKLRDGSGRPATWVHPRVAKHLAQWLSRRSCLSGKWQRIPDDSPPLGAATIGIEEISREITVNSAGHGFITAKGVSRLLGLQSPSALGVDRFPKKLAETFAQQGLSGVDRPFSDIALTLIAEYYAYYAQNTTGQARQVYRTLAATSARSWMQQVKGWAPREQRRELPGDERAYRLMLTAKFFFDDPSPRLKQALSDMAGNFMGLTPDSLPSTTERWCGVAERAEELGYPVAEVTRKRSELGKYVKKHYQGEIRREKRLCNGTQREINLYKIDDRLDSCIIAYLGQSPAIDR